MRDRVHLLTVLRFDVQADLGVFGLIPIAVITLALLTSLQEVVEGLESLFAVGDFEAFAEFKFFVAHDGARAVVAHAAEGFEDDVEESLVVNRSCEVDMSKVTYKLKEY